MPSANVIQLRQMLAEKFPGLRLRLEDSPLEAARVWPTGMPQIDEPLGGGLPKGALTEVVCSENGSGSATLLRALLFHGAMQKQVVTLVDGHDSLEIAELDEATSSRLLWVRCRNPEEALKAADLILRDANLPVLLLDLKMATVAQARRISPTAWFRFQRLVEETGTMGIVFTPRRMVSSAQIQITMRESFSLRTLESDFEDLLRELKVETVDLRHGFGQSGAMQNTA